MTWALRANLHESLAPQRGRSDRWPGSNFLSAQEKRRPLGVVGNAVGFGVAENLQNVGLLHESNLGNDGRTIPSHTGVTVKRFRLAMPRLLPG